MKKIIPILLVGVLVLSGLGAGAVHNEQIKQQRTTLSFSNLSIQEKDDCITLNLEGTNSVLMKRNHYMVPTCIKTFTFPFGTEIKSIQCTPKNIQIQTITKKLMVTPEPVTMGQTSLNEQIEESTINPKSTSDWYKYDVGVGIINANERGTIVRLQILPVQYYQSENLIEWAKNVEIKIDYKEPEQPAAFDDQYRFVVLAPAEFSDELEDLVDHKNDREISTIFVSLDDIYTGVYFPVEGRDDQEKIKYFIKNAFDSWGTSYVLLVGGSAKFPTRSTHIHIDSSPPDNEIFVSDLYYADIYNETYAFSSWDTNENDVFGEFEWGSSHLTDDVDLYPDVFIGRLACINYNEVTTSVNKIITYETNEAYTQEWFTDLVVVGGDSFPGDDNSIDEGEYVNEAVVNVMGGFIPNRMWASNGELTGIAPSGSTKLTNALNEGAGFVDFSGHGNTAVWATHPHEDKNTWLPTLYGRYSNSNIADLTNGDELPIVVIGACSVSKYNIDNDCFGWSFVSNPDGGGIGSFGATGLGWAYTGEWVTEGLVEGMALNVFEAFKDEGATTFGEMWGKAITNYLFPGMEDVDYKTVEEWQSFGDPTLAVAGQSQPPEKPETPDGATSGKINEEYTYTSSTTDPDVDQVYYLFDWGDGEFSGWIGPYDSGDTAEASHIWTEQDDYEIKVKSKDVHGVQSEWSDPLPISMPKNKGFFNSLLLNILEKFIERFPILGQILSNRPILSNILDI